MLLKSEDYASRDFVWHVFKFPCLIAVSHQQSAVSEERIDLVRDLLLTAESRLLTAILNLLLTAESFRLLTAILMAIHLSIWLVNVRLPLRPRCASCRMLARRT